MALSIFFCSVTIPPVPFGTTSLYTREAKIDALRCVRVLAFPLGGAATSPLTAEPCCKFFKSAFLIGGRARTESIPALPTLLAPLHDDTAQNIITAIAFTFDFMPENRVMLAVITT